MSNIEEPLVNPRIIVGDQTVQPMATLKSFDMFTLDHNGTFTVFDRNWNQISKCSVGVFNPTNLATFEMGPVVPAPPIWLEIGVAGATETVPNPAHTIAGSDRSDL